ncbi:MAG: hypothetical protein V3S71_05335 [Acidobacteriota bacterium]
MAGPLFHVPERARPAFAGIRGDERVWTWVYSEAPDFEGMVYNELPSFWKPALSHAFADIGIAGDPPSRPYTQARKGARTPTEELRAQAKYLVRQQSMSYAKAGRLMGLPKSTVWDLVNG